MTGKRMCVDPIRGARDKAGQIGWIASMPMQKD